MSGITFEEYIKNRFEGAVEILDDSSSDMSVWTPVLSLAESSGAALAINKTLCPRFPVDYKDPDSVSFEIYHSIAGDIPVISAGNPDDFEALVTNIVHKGVHPDNISKTGAAFIFGDTICFIILSSKPYSNVPAEELGLEEDDWALKSMLIRRSHECTHYFTKKTYGISNNLLHDELMADFMGLYDAFGFYRAEWFLRFLGIIEGGGSRLDVYTEGLTPQVLAQVTDIITRASYGLEKWSESEEFKKLTAEERIKEMCTAGICGMAHWNEE